LINAIRFSHLRSDYSNSGLKIRRGQNLLRFFRRRQRKLVVEGQGHAQGVKTRAEVGGRGRNGDVDLHAANVADWGGGGNAFSFKVREA